MQLSPRQRSIIFGGKDFQNIAAPGLNPFSREGDKVQDKIFQPHSSVDPGGFVGKALLKDVEKQISNGTQIQVNGIHFQIIKGQMIPAKVIIQFFKMMFSRTAPLIVKCNTRQSIPCIIGQYRIVAVAGSLSKAELSL